MARLGGHALAKYTTGTLIGTSEGQGWNGVLAERWSHLEGDLGEIEIRDTEVIVMIDGNLQVRRRGDGNLEHCHAVPGTVWLCPDGVREDMIRLYGDIRESIHLVLPASPLSETALREFDVDPDRVELNYRGGFHDPLIERIARAIRSEMLDPAPAGKLLVETLATAIGVHMLSCYSNLSRAAVPAARGALDPRRLRRVVDFMEAQLGEDLTIGRLADEACLSPFHFSRAFKAATGTTPHRFLTVRRIRRARALLADGALSLGEIGVACGFSSQAHFTRCFKGLVGTTPGEYRADCSSGPGVGVKSSKGDKMDLTTERQGAALLVAVSGRLDQSSAPTLIQDVQRATEQSDRALILDLGGLAYIGSAGLRAILVVAKDLAKRDANLLLCALPSRIRKVVTLSGFDRLLRIHETRADALASLESG